MRAGSFFHSTAASLARRIANYLDMELLERDPFRKQFNDLMNEHELNLLDVLVEHTLSRTERHGVLLQIGANDGRTDDDVHEIVRGHALSAILVEPNPKSFSRLVQNYGSMQNVILENVAITADEERSSITIWSVEGEGIPVEADVFASQDRSRMEKFAQSAYGGRGRLMEYRVPAMSVRQLLDKHDVKHVYAIVIDTEGYDSEILNALDVEVFAPTIIQFEHLHFWGEQLVQCCRRLVVRGYELVSTRRDIIAVKNCHLD